ncbi:MAG: alpha-amylase family protein [Candidatus Dormibacteria bacterium]
MLRCSHGALVDGRLRRADEAGAVHRPFPGRDRTIVSTLPDGLCLSLGVGLAGDEQVLVAGAHWPERAGATVDIIFPVIVDGDLRDDSLLAELNLEWSLVDGFQSWDYAGLARGGSHLTPLPVEPVLAGMSLLTRSWWSACFGGSQGALAVQALSARRTVTSVRWEASPAGRISTLVIEQADAPFSLMEQRSGAPEPLRARIDQDWVLGDPVALSFGSDAAAVRGALAARAGRANPRAGAGAPVTGGWLSWYHHGRTVNPGVVRDNARRLLDLDPGRRVLNTVLIDDGWQNAYGDWQPGDRFGGEPGMQELCGELSAMGLLPGIWWAPFLVDPSGWFAEDAAARGWLLLGPDGSPLVDGRQPDLGALVLDAANPEVLLHLESRARRFQEWGFRLIKSDFLYAGAYHAGRARTMPGIAALRDFVEGLRRATPGVYHISCGSPWPAAVGSADLWRCGGDIGFPRYDAHGGALEPGVGMVSVYMQLRNLIARQPLQSMGTVLDPDALMITGPPEGPPFNLREARAVALAWAISGAPLFLGDDLPSLPPPKLAVLREVIASGLVGGAPLTPIDPDLMWETTPYDHFLTLAPLPPPRWIHRGPESTVVALFDWDGLHPTMDLDLAGLALSGQRARDLLAGSDLGLAANHLTVDLSPGAVALEFRP